MYRIAIPLPKVMFEHIANHCHWVDSPTINKLCLDRRDTEYRLYLHKSRVTTNLCTLDGQAITNCCALHQMTNYQPLGHNEQPIDKYGNMDKN